ncbi:hypothetical protein G4G27_14080 [Sphingomonas sp. So64.6b]|uniref:hypothetical protein n=1 Tax=Sphingomonas sp. So64.6b TaxID=2997354 RepID=UPI0016000925|nr:hypothetical protein [Sphingomonas sp. So64.6b]QNA84998.1 hypothetical protein G4G27_14080 [Sphingomonas sp. So64.6b]
MRKLFWGLALLGSATLVSPAWGQATTRPCSVEESVGPACLLARQEFSSLPSKSLYWHLDQFASKEAAQAAAISTSTVIDAFGSIWLFTIERRSWRPKNGKHISDIGPLPVQPASTYAAEYLRSVFSPGMTAPLHVHSGPEAFYAVSGDTCLETPEGVQLGRGPGNSLLIKGGPPMLLMAVGKERRRGFALILHDAHQPPTTLTHDWHPQGLCERQLPGDQAK